MQRRFTEAETQVASAFVAILGLAALPTVLLGTPLPIAVGFFVLAIGVSGLIYFSARSTDDQSYSGLVVSQVLAVVFFASTCAFAAAWVSERPTDPTAVEFVVVPYDLVAVESVVPGPHRESQTAAPHGYGDHVLVSCHVKGVDGRRWYQLRNHNFMESRDLAPILFSEDRPPAC